MRFPKRVRGIATLAAVCRVYIDTLESNQVIIIGFCFCYIKKISKKKERGNSSLRVSDG